MRGKFSKSGDALGLVTVRFRQLSNLRFQRRQQFEQLALSLFFDGITALNSRLDFGNRILDHYVSFLLPKYRTSSTGATCFQISALIVSIEPTPFIARTLAGSDSAMH